MGGACCTSSTAPIDSSSSISHTTKNLGNGVMIIEPSSPSASVDHIGKRNSHHNPSAAAAAAAASGASGGGGHAGHHHIHHTHSGNNGGDGSSGSSGASGSSAASSGSGGSNESGGGGHGIASGRTMVLTHLQMKRAKQIALGKSLSWRWCVATQHQINIYAMHPSPSPQPSMSLMTATTSSSSSSTSSSSSSTSSSITSAQIESEERLMATIGIPESWTIVQIAATGSWLAIAMYRSTGWYYYQREPSSSDEPQLHHSTALIALWQFTSRPTLICYFPLPGLPERFTLHNFFFVPAWSNPTLPPLVTTPTSNDTPAAHQQQQQQQQQQSQTGVVCHPCLIAHYAHEGHPNAWLACWSLDEMIHFPAILESRYVRGLNRTASTCYFTENTEPVSEIPSQWPPVPLVTRDIDTLGLWILRVCLVCSTSTSPSLVVAMMRSPASTTIVEEMRIWQFQSSSDTIGISNIDPPTMDLPDIGAIDMFGACPPLRIIKGPWDDVSQLGDSSLFWVHPVMDDGPSLIINVRTALRYSIMDESHAPPPLSETTPTNANSNFGMGGGTNTDVNRYDLDVIVNQAPHAWLYDRWLVWTSLSSKRIRTKSNVSSSSSPTGNNNHHHQLLVFDLQTAMIWQDKNPQPLTWPHLTAGSPHRIPSRPITGGGGGVSRGEAPPSIIIDREGDMSPVVPPSVVTYRVIPTPFIFSEILSSGRDWILFKRPVLTNTNGSLSAATGGSTLPPPTQFVTGVSIPTPSPRGSKRMTTEIWIWRISPAELTPALSPPSLPLTTTTLAAALSGDSPTGASTTTSTGSGRRRKKTLASLATLAGNNAVTHRIAIVQQNGGNGDIDRDKWSFHHINDGNADYGRRTLLLEHARKRRPVGTTMSTGSSLVVGLNNASSNSNNGNELQPSMIQAWPLDDYHGNGYYDSNIMYVPICERILQSNHASITGIGNIPSSSMSSGITRSVMTTALAPLPAAVEEACIVITRSLRYGDDKWPESLIVIVVDYVLGQWMY
jgi:hypothetical protein